MMQTNLTRLASAAMFISSAFAASPTKSATPVREVEKPALSAVAASCNVDLLTLNSGICAAMTVPAGKVFVMEQVSAACAFNDAAPVAVLALSVRTSIGSNPNVDLEIPMVKQATGNGFAYWKGSPAVRSYADSGTVIQPFAMRTSSDVVTFGVCSVTLIGHYIEPQ
jgi:hypothetical protein